MTDPKKKVGENTALVRSKKGGIERRGREVSFFKKVIKRLDKREVNS